MLNSVRTRLTLWYTAVLACVLVALALATYFVVRNSLRHRTDSALAELADSFLTTVHAELRNGGEANSIGEATQAAISEHRFRDIVFVVLDGEREVVASSEGASYLGNAPSQVASGSSAHSPAEPSSFRTLNLRREDYRVYLEPFSVLNGHYMLVVFQSLHRQNELLETLSGTFTFVIPLAVLLASAGGYFLARRSLSPVVAMSTQAGRIGAENLHDRLAITNAADELGHLAASFNQLLDRLDHSFEQQRRFVADASHELRTPVAILYGEADVALSQSERSPSEYRESLSILRAEAKRLKHIVEDLFTLARADAGQHPLTLTDFYLDEVVAECARNFRALASARQITLVCDVPGELPVRADEGLISRLVMNLLDNAVKYTPRGGAVRVACERQNGHYLISIQDTGQGIPRELQPKIFERFFRVDKVRSRTETDGGGAGLGLAISSWIAQAHGGRIELSRSGPEGSTFTVVLPVASA